MFYKSVHSNFKTTRQNIYKDQLRSFSNKRISFSGFIKLLICISNKLFNPSIKNTTINMSTLNVDQLTNLEPYEMYVFFENFISVYLIPIFDDVKTIFQNEFSDFEALHNIMNEEFIVNFKMMIGIVRHKI